MTLMVTDPDRGTRTIYVTGFEEAATILKTLMLMHPDRAFGDLANDLLAQIADGSYSFHTFMRHGYEIGIS